MKFSRHEPVRIHFGPERYGQAHGRADLGFVKPLALGVAALAMIGVVGAGATVAYRALPVAVAAEAAAPVAEVATSPAPPPVAPEGLQASLDALAAEYGESLGLAVMDVDAGWTAAVAGDSAFPQQSVSKLWVTLAVLDAVDQGDLTLDMPVVMAPEDRSVFSQPLANEVAKSGAKTLPLSELIGRAISQSDNSANDKLISLISHERVTTTLTAKQVSGIRHHGDEKTLQSAIAGMTWKPEYALGRSFQTARAELPLAERQKAMADYLADPYDGATPTAMVTALARLKRGELLSADSTAFLLQTLAETRTGPRRLKGGLPAGWSIGHKTGTGQDLSGFTAGYNDVALITAPDGRSYAVAVLMGKTTKPNPQRMAFMQSVSRAVVDHWARTHAPEEPAAEAEPATAA